MDRRHQRPSLPLLGLAIALGGCATRSTTGDYRTTRELVAQRGLSMPAHPPATGQPTSDPDVRKLLTQPLTASAAERIALLQNRELRAELQEIGIARGQLVQASALPNPEVEVEMLVPTEAGHATEWSLGLGIPLAPLLARGARTGAAEAELDAARSRVAGAVIDLGVRVRQAFYALSAKQAHLAVLHTEVASFAVAAETARALHDAGNIPELDLVSHQAAHEGARMAVFDAEAEVQAARERLGALLGLAATDTSWTLAEAAPDLTPIAADAVDLERKALDASLDLARLRAQAGASDERASAVQTSGWLAGLEVGVGAELADEHWAVGPKLAGTLPLFDRGQGGADSERARAMQLRERALATAQEVRAATRTLSARLKAATERAKHCREVLLPLRKRVVKETLLQYNAMQIGVFELLRQKRAELESEHACIDAELGHWMTRAELDALLAGKLPSGSMPAANDTASHVGAGSEPAAGH